jgi:hypothetical protein
MMNATIATPGKELDFRFALVKRGARCFSTIDRLALALPSLDSILSWHVHASPLQQHTALPLQAPLPTVLMALSFLFQVRTPIFTVQRRAS